MLDMDSTEVPVYGRREQSAYNGHFESTCYHPLLLFNREGDCLAAKLRPGNVQIFPRNTWEHCGPKSAKTLQRKAVRCIERVGIGKSKKEIPLKANSGLLSDVT
jgi:hypothetical protein